MGTFLLCLGQVALSYLKGRPDHEPLRTGVPRNPAFERKARAFLAGKVCVACGGATKLQCHHKFPYHLYPQLEMDERYWRPLCMNPEYEDHLRVGHHGNWTKFNADVDAEAAALYRQRTGG